MKTLFIILFALMSMTATAQTWKCGATTKAGTACTRTVTKQGAKCWQHGGAIKAQGASISAPTAICGATTKAGGKCKNRVKGGGRCHLHKG